MALKPTIYKLRIALSDLERNHYDTLNLTVALHPSETVERMMARVMAFSIFAQSDLAFTKGLSDVEEPDIWVKTLDDKVTLWIDVGEPDPERVKKAVRKAEKVVVVSFNSKSDTWWELNRSKLERHDAEYIQFPFEIIERLASSIERTVDCSITITGQSAYFASDSVELDIPWKSLRSS